MVKTVNILKWYGGKWRQCKDILPLFPKNIVHFVDVYGGGGTVILNTPDYHLKTYNDIDSELVNFFKQLRDNSEELVQKLMLTPYSREELSLCYENAEDDLERARRFFVKVRQSYGGIISRKPRWSRSLHKGQNLKNNVPVKFQRLVREIYEIAEIFSCIQIENKDGIQLIKECDFEGCFFYCDPPYVHGVRYSKDDYRYEMEDEQHEQLGKTLNGIKGRCIISGYKSELYDKLFSNWNRIDFEEKMIATGKRDKKRQESVWLNYDSKTGEKI